MRFLFGCMVLCVAVAGHAQQFVCGLPVAKADAGAIQLASSSLASATAAGFDLNTTPEVKDGYCML